MKKKMETAFGLKEIEKISKMKKIRRKIWNCMFIILSLCLCSCNSVLSNGMKQEDLAECQIVAENENESGDEPSQVTIEDSAQNITENNLMQKNREKFYDRGK